MEIVLIRHGMTLGNSKSQYIGSTDEPLCEAGRLAAEAIGGFPDVQKVYVSPMLRTRQTASILFPNASQTLIDDLREMDFGIFERRSADDMENDTDYRSWVDGNCEGVCPGGEGVWDVIARTKRALISNVRAAMARGEERFIAVVHGGVIMSLMYELALPKRDYYDWFVGNCSGYRAQFTESPSGPRLTRWSYFSFEKEK